MANRTISLLLIITTTSLLLNAQGYLHTDGKNIVNGDDETIILRGIGTGNWMLQEGYMMKTEGVAGTQHEFRAKLIETIGEEKTDSFYNVWLANHFRRIDVDSMKAWGFNSVRVALHYKWFTLPIEEEPVTGENTWLEKGFIMLDSLMDWCSDAEMYLIFDLHGAPGGQGENADISDYDPSKPSLWESQENKDKTIALWRRIAERYSEEVWNGGYDLINETNWTFPEGNNSQMRELFGAITHAIREVDTNHIIYIEGNSFANDHSGLTPPWDDNLVYSFHKYWSGTGPNDLDWILSLRDANNVPLWLGESGENSNTWFTDLITLAEKNNIGWSWWPVKKNWFNNILNVSLNEEYDNLVKYWRGEISTAPSEEEAFQAVLQWAENHKLENCKIQYDVIDAMIRQPQTDETKPFKHRKVSDPIYASDFDLGKNNYAYFDQVVARYGSDWTAWNNGGLYRNDGVDIETCTDSPLSNGYNVGWTEDEEWMQYSLVTDSAAAYRINIRSASGSGGSSIHLEVNGSDITGNFQLPASGGWQNWQTTSLDNIILPAGELKIKFVFDQGGSNLNYFSFSDPSPVDSTEFCFISAETSANGEEIFLTLNKEVTTPEASLSGDDFILHKDGNPVDIESISISAWSDRVLLLKPGETMQFNNTILISYDGSSVQHNTQYLEHFMEEPVANRLPDRYIIPGRIQAEDFFINNGFELESCSDAGNGYNTAYAAPGDYLVYLVYIPAGGYYMVSYRVATQYSNAELVFQMRQGANYASLDTIRFSSTNGWQNWQTQSGGFFYLEEGYQTIRLYVKQGEHNLNWFQLSVYNSLNPVEGHIPLKVFPNPAQDYFRIEYFGKVSDHCRFQLYSSSGTLVLDHIELREGEILIDTGNLPNGIYYLRLREGTKLMGRANIVISR